MVSTRISLQQEEWPDVHLSPAREEDLSIAPFLTSEPQPNDTLMVSALHEMPKHLHDIMFHF